MVFAMLRRQYETSGGLLIRRKQARSSTRLTPDHVYVIGKLLGVCIFFMSSSALYNHDINVYIAHIICNSRSAMRSR